MLRSSAAAAGLLSLQALPRTRAATGVASAAIPPRRPNILMLVADDYRHDALRCRGDGVVQTPNLDRLAAAGTTFCQAHQMGGKFPAVCVPTRGALWTGCNVFRAMKDPADNIISTSRLTMGQHLRLNGYHTHIFGKWHNDFASLNRTFADGESIFLRGLNTDQYRMRVNHYDPTGVYGKNTVHYAKKFSTDFLADHAVDYLENYRGEQPFFLYTGFTAPHDPRTPPREFAEMYTPEKMPLPKNFAARHPFDNGELKVRDEEIAPHPRSPARVREEIASYYGMISSLDAGVGRILAALEASGQADNTIVIFTADHGLAVGQHGLMGKQNLYDHSTRVPLLMRGPGIPEGQCHDALCYSWDLFPTLCDLATVKTPGGLDAKSLAPLLRGSETVHRSEIHGLYRDFQRTAKNDRFKLIEYAVGENRHTQLFDLKNDPWEMRDLSPDAAANSTLEELRGSMRRWQQAVGDRGFVVPA